MAIKTKHKKGGYSATTAIEYVNPTKPIYSLSIELEPQQLFEDGKPTGEIIAYKATFVQEGLEPFQVKFEDKVKLLNFLDWLNLTTCKLLRFATTSTSKLIISRRSNNDQEGIVTVSASKSQYGTWSPYARRK